MKQILLKLTILFLVASIPVVLFNFFIDPYGIFNDLSLELWCGPGYEPNQHFAKMRHLINDKHSWDSYIFGSSRAGKINPELMHDGNYYNMNYSEGVPGEHLDDIKVLLENNIPVKNVIIGLDNFSYMLSPGEHRGQFMRHPYDSSDLKRYFFMLKYLYSVPRLNIIDEFRSQDNEFSIHFSIFGNGMQNMERIDNNIEKNIGRHISSERFSQANNITFDKEHEQKYMKLIEDTLRDIAEIIKLSEKNNFNLYIFINPTHVKFYLQGNPYHLLIFKEKLAQLTDYWDFSGLNSITTDNYYYYETSHYRTIVGDLILCKISKCSEITVPEDFGVLVTRGNISRHIKIQKDELIAMHTMN